MLQKLTMHDVVHGLWHNNNVGQLITFMNKYALILSDKTEDALASTYHKCEEALRPTSQRILRIQPHLLLVQAEQDLEVMALTLRTLLPTHDNWLLLELRPAWRGAAMLERFADLQQFFAVP